MDNMRLFERERVLTACLRAWNPPPQHYPWDNGVGGRTNFSGEEFS